MRQLLLLVPLVLAACEAEPLSPEPTPIEDLPPCAQIAELYGSPYLNPIQREKLWKQAEKEGCF